MSTEFDRYEVERQIKSYSNDILSAFDSPIPSDESTKKNSIARAQSLLSDFEYLNKIVSDLREQVKGAQRRNSGAMRGFIAQRPLE